jgi:hypothetical protein
MRKLSMPKVEVAATPLQLVNEKYRHCQEKVRKLEKALGRESAARAEGDALMHDLN